MQVLIIDHIYELNDHAFESIVTAIYFRAWKDFETHAGINLTPTNARTRFALNNFLASQHHQKERRRLWQSPDVALMSIYRTAVEDIQYRSGVNQGYITIPIAVQKNANDVFKNAINQLSKQGLSSQSRSI
jgi:hypothetical protein